MYQTVKDTVNINETTIYFELYQNTPDKPVIVLIHGFLSSIFSFRHVIPLLSKNFTVLAVDLPPFGKSGKTKAFYYSYFNMADTVIKLLHQLQFNKVIVAGHSMGGQIALNMALHNPTIVEKTVLLNSSGYQKRLKNSIIFSSYLPFFDHYVKRWLAKKGVVGNLRNVVHDHSLIDDEMISGYSEPFNNHEIFVGLTRMIRHREGDLIPNQLQRIQNPSLLLWGEHDRVVPLEIGKRLNKDLPNSSLISIPSTGHLLPEEKPKIVNEYILNFVYS